MIESLYRSLLFSAGSFGPHTSARHNSRRIRVQTFMGAYVSQFGLNDARQLFLNHLVVVTAVHRKELARLRTVVYRTEIISLYAYNRVDSILIFGHVSEQLQTLLFALHARQQDDTVVVKLVKRMTQFQMISFGDVCCTRCRKAG